MRSVGVPARVVTGYQGGELGRDGASWEVRQMDAHAWAEVWIVGEGWVRIDPTGFVAPHRVEMGMTAFTDDAGAEAFGDGVAGTWGYQQFRLMQSLRRYADQASYYWQRDIVGYDQDAQRNSLFKWFNIQSLAQQLLVLAGLAVGIFGLFVAYAFYRRRRIYHPLDAPVMRLSRQLAKQDKALALQTGESVLSYLTRISAAATAHPANTAKADEIGTLLTQLQADYRTGRYGQDELNKAQMQAFSQQMQALTRYF